MHRERLGKVIAFLETLPDEAFDMHVWMNGPGTMYINTPPEPLCGTRGCIAGWTIALQGKGLEEGDYLRTAANWLELDFREYQRFFAICYKDATRKEAIGELRQFMKDWEEAYELEKIERPD